MALLTAFLIPYLAAVCQALVVFEDIAAPPEYWHYVGAPLATQDLSFSIAINHDKEGELEKALLDVSTPGNAKYGQHLSREDLATLLTPSISKVNGIITWLSGSGISSPNISTERDWIDVVTSVSQAEELFNTKFGTYAHNRHGGTVVRALQFSVPEGLYDSIDSIHAITSFPFEPGRPASHLSTDESEMVDENEPALSDLKYCGKTKINNVSAVIPPCVREIYNVPHTIKFNASANNKVGVFEIPPEYTSRKDLAKFEKLYAPYAAGQDFTYTPVFGGPLKHKPVGAESQIDTEWAVSIAFPLPVEVFIVGPGIFKTNAEYFADYSHFLRHLLRLPDSELPRVVSFSYLFSEERYGKAQGHGKVLRKLCSLFGQVAARGVSILAATGDGGATGYYTCMNYGNRTFRAIFPATCPWVTAVGGTANPGNERAGIYSSGGLSSIFQRPKYQDKAVQEYFYHVGRKTNAGLFNPDGRAVPDIAAMGHRMASLVSGREEILRGTSFASPILSGIVALLNAERNIHGKPPLGFLNPWIYSGGYEGLNDITKGASLSDFCRKEHVFWNATKGYDLVTGWGTPNYKKLRELALQI